MTDDDAIHHSSSLPAALHAGDGLIMLASGLVGAGAVVAAAFGAEPAETVPATPLLLALIAAGFIAGAQLPLLARLGYAARRARADARRLAAALRDEHVLFQDLQHRVANAMQFAASLLSLAASHVRGPEDAQAALEDAAARLAGMAVIHRRLHDPTLGEDRLAETLAALGRDLLAVRGRQDIALAVTVADAVPTLGLARVSAIASIVVEAVTNAVKHAFGAQEGGTLAITLGVATDGLLVLSIVDDGRGPPAEPPDPTSLGLAVMEAMAARLGGLFTLEAAPGGGAAVLVRFPAHSSGA
jgi:two-component sensor histidine kinase